MIIECPSCGQGYDTTGYPEHYRFSCSCGYIIDTSALAKLSDSKSQTAVQTDKDAHHNKTDSRSSPEKEQTTDHQTQIGFNQKPPSGKALSSEDDESAAIELSDESAAIELSDESAAIELSDESAAIELSDESAAIELSDESAAIELSDESAAIELSDESAAIELYDEFDNPEATMRTKPPAFNVNDLDVLARKWIDERDDSESDLPKSKSDARLEQISALEGDDELAHTLLPTHQDESEGLLLDINIDIDDDDEQFGVHESTAVTLSPYYQSDLSAEVSYSPPSTSTVSPPSPHPSYAPQYYPHSATTPAPAYISATPSNEHIIPEQKPDSRWHGEAQILQQTPHWQAEYHRPTYNPQVQSQAAPSWSNPLAVDETSRNIESSDDLHSAPSQSAASVLPKRIESSVLLGFLLLPFVIFGLFSWILASRGLRNIRMDPNLYKGHFLASLTILVGMIETFALIGMICLVAFVPQIHPLATQVASIFGQKSEQTEEDAFVKRVSEPPILLNDLAYRHLQIYFDQHKLSQLPKESELYVHQEDNQAHAYVYWRDQQSQLNRRGLFFRSQRGHWHLVQIEPIYTEEVRVFAAGPALLRSEIAKKLIHKFWQLRGRFSEVSIQKLYVVQQPNTRHALAYWQLRKQMPDQTLRQWKLASRFRRSTGGQWYLAQYAMRIDDDEDFRYSAHGQARLSLELTVQLLMTYHRDQKQAFSAHRLLIHQPPSALEAIVFWQNSRRGQAQHSVLRLDTEQDWHLAVPNAQSPYLINPESSENMQLSNQAAQQHIQEYLRKQQLPSQIKQLYVYQPDHGHIAYVRWLPYQPPARLPLRNPKPISPRQSLFHYLHNGSWNLSKLDVSPAYEVIASLKGAERLSAEVANHIIRQYWKEDDRTFSGARIKDLYVYQEPDSLTAWAHWNMTRNDITTALRSRFFRSNNNIWFLGTYDLSSNYMIDYRALGPSYLSANIANQIIQQYLDKNISDSKPQIRDIYVYQEPHTHQAYTRWLRQSNDKASVIYSLFHRSNDNHWYLSVAELPTPPQPSLNLQTSTKKLLQKP
jgi:hypothetical protein